MYIASYCHIRQQTLTYNGEVIFKGNPGNLDAFLTDAFQFLKIAYPKFYKMDRLSKLGLLASELLIRDSTAKRECKPDQIALVLANAHASLDTDVRYLESTKSMASPSLFVYTLSNIVAGEICIRHGIKGENAFFVQPAFDADFMAQYVNQLLTETKNEMCLAGWADVMGEHHDVFLYLAVKEGNGIAQLHTGEELQKLYQSNYGSVDLQS
ncbi:MAG: beta-ketoacyl synthase N-terminal-like domain-containing protein [Chryseolinea sp.]